MITGSLFSAPVLREALGFPLRRSILRGPLFTLLVVYLALFLLFPPFAALIEAGYALQVARRILAGGPAELVEPGPWEAVLMDGLRCWAVVIIFSLPALLLALAGGLASLWISGALGPRGMYAYLLFLSEHFWPVYLFIALVLLLSLLAWIFGTIASLHMAGRGSFASAFQVRDWWPVLRANRGGFAQVEVFLIVFGLVMLLIQVVFAIPTLITCVGPVVVLGLAALYQRLVLTAVYAREYRIGKERLKG